VENVGQVILIDVILSYHALNNDYVCSRNPVRFSDPDGRQPEASGVKNSSIGFTKDFKNDSTTVTVGPVEVKQKEDKQFEHISLKVGPAKVSVTDKATIEAEVSVKHEVKIGPARVEAEVGGKADVRILPTDVDPYAVAQVKVNIFGSIKAKVMRIFGVS
jgi:hypothetical protein